MMVHLAACCDNIFFLIICKLIEGLKFSVAKDIYTRDCQEQIQPAVRGRDLKSGPPDYKSLAHASSCFCLNIFLCTILFL